jgi:hypothetical protein
MPPQVKESAAFDPETIALLIQAYEAAVQLVGTDQPPYVLETIARDIIDIAGAGERDTQRMVEFAVGAVERFQGPRSNRNTVWNH